MDANIRTFKDFLQIYNNLSEMCFKNCVVSFNSRLLEDSEEKCVEDCSAKFIKLNHRFMAIYTEYQQIIVNKRIKEAEEQANQASIAENSVVSNVQEESISIPTS
ncbi:hypothetical protein ILUMI_26986 [Ignelater luminosus]|uniref:Mitochondrial import inner membrane translocase subunit n=1 Tax=Ignelater luminosus TaxID=2038154 RepID=A0A8K0C5X2_IGNLU|nr:hypothetical protein ILUMI_26986 [Ignelater luminosus]